MGLAILTDVVELRELAPVQDQRILRCTHDLHVGFQDLRAVVLTESQRDIVFEPVLLSFRDDLGDLLERTEHDHARCAPFPFHGFFLQQPVTEMEVFCDIESEVGIECRFPGLIALSVPVISVHIPIRAAGVEVRPDVIRDVGDHQLCLGNVVGLEVLEVVMEQDTSGFSHLRPPVPAGKMPPHRTSTFDRHGGHTHPRSDLRCARYSA